MGKKILLIEENNALRKNTAEILELADYEDAAAGYAIQRFGALFVEKIEGDYFNVVGFPIYRFGHLMKQIGAPVFEIITS